ITFSSWSKMGWCASKNAWLRTDLIAQMFTTSPYLAVVQILHPMVQLLHQGVVQLLHPESVSLLNQSMNHPLTP
ncbi:hypothetical protein, partial [Escherichia coli]|uniref:hypothetical protein n=1 Tax=Escherichia coli TaxID=562 RepID=UPI001953184F